MSRTNARVSIFDRLPPIGCRTREVVNCATHTRAFESGQFLSRRNCRHPFPPAPPPAWPVASRLPNRLPRSALQLRVSPQYTADLRSHSRPNSFRTTTSENSPRTLLAVHAVGCEWPHFERIVGYWQGIRALLLQDALVRLRFATDSRFFQLPRGVARRLFNTPGNIARTILSWRRNLGRRSGFSCVVHVVDYMVDRGCLHRMLRQRLELARKTKAHSPNLVHLLTNY